jgi:hypothetical protein
LRDPRAGTAAAASASSVHTVSYTDNFHGVQLFDQVNPCTGDEITGSEASNLVMHVTYFPASDESWGAFTEEDNFSALLRRLPHAIPPPPTLGSPSGCQYRGADPAAHTRRQVTCPREDPKPAAGYSSGAQFGLEPGGYAGQRKRLQTLGPGHADPGRPQPAGSCCQPGRVRRVGIPACIASAQMALDLVPAYSCDLGGPYR